MSVHFDEWKKYQTESSKYIIEEDKFDIDHIKYVAGLDISFDKKNPNRSCAYITIQNYSSKEIVYEDHEITLLDIPYVSGFLGFREIPVYKILFDRLKKNNIKYMPDIIFVDGFGILHPRGFGSASHLGLELDIPTIGVGKTLLSIDGFDEYEIKNKFKKMCVKKGDFVNIIGTTGKIYGAALKSSYSINPIYVSVGHKISLASALQIVNNLCMYKNPEPIRNSDIKSKLYF